jgi:hypothetical protein
LIAVYVVFSLLLSEILRQSARVFLYFYLCISGANISPVYGKEHIGIVLLSIPSNNV